MATTYTTLLAEVANYLSRSDLTSIIPTFVQLAQARINRDVRAKAMQTKNTSVTINAEYEDAPTDFLEVASFYLTSTTPRKPLEFMDMDTMTRDYNTTGEPKYYSVVGTQFRFAPTPPGDYTATLVYYAKPATLATTTQETNSLFPSVAPDLYLYASLLEAESYIQNDPRLATWSEAYQRGVESLNAAQKNSRHGGPMTTRAS
jgi:hypothetical protein